MEDLNKYVSIYKKQLDEGNIQKAYTGIVKYVMNLKTVFKKDHSDKFSVGNILQGYMDYTYFYFSNTYLEKYKLKLGLVLNHQDMRFEIWLLGRTVDVQKKYWELLKASKWNKGREEMPKYSILEGIIVENPDFNNLDQLTKEIENRTIQISDEILSELKTVH